jgi:RNA polymerase sigma-70 factor (ECF subfamily)
MDSNETIKKIRSGSKQLLAQVYRDYRTSFIEWLCASQGIPVDEATEIYQQTIIVFYENIVSGRLTELKSNIRTYLFAIGKNKVNELRRHTARNSSFQDYHGNMIEEDSEEKQQKEQMINLSRKCLELLGDPCRKLLELYYYHKRNMQQIADEMGYKNENSTKNQKYKCLEKLRVMFRNKVKKEVQFDYGI